MATLTRYETFEELKADRPAISGDLLAQKLENKDFEEFILFLRKHIIVKKNIDNLSIKNGKQI